MIIRALANREDDEFRTALIELTVRPYSAKPRKPAERSEKSKTSLLLPQDVSHVALVDVPIRFFRLEASGGVHFGFISGLGS